MNQVVTVHVSVTDETLYLVFFNLNSYFTFQFIFQKRSTQNNFQEASAMQGKELRLKSRRADEGQKDEQYSTNRQDRVRMPRVPRGEGSKSSPVIARHLRPLVLSNRSRSEGNLIAAQTFDLKSRGEVSVGQHERTLHLPTLQQIKSPKTSLLTDNDELKEKAFSKQVTETSRGSSIKFVLNDNHHRTMLNEYIKQENSEYQSGGFKRDSLLRWLSEQNISNS